MPVPLRTDYLADLGAAYGRGQTRRSNLASAEENRRVSMQNRQMQQIKLDEFYKEQEFLKGFGEYYTQKAQEVPDYPIEQAGIEYSRAMKRPDKIPLFEEYGRKRQEHRKNMVTGIGDSIHKLRIAGEGLEDPSYYLKQSADAIRSMGKEWKNWKPEDAKSVSENHVDVYEHPETKEKIVYLPKAKSYFKFDPRVSYETDDFPTMVNGRPHRFARNPKNPEKDKFDLGPFVEAPSKGPKQGGDGKSSKDIQMISWLENKGVPKELIVRWAMGERWKSAEEIAFRETVKFATETAMPMETAEGQEEFQRMYNILYEQIESVRKQQLGGGAPEPQPPEPQVGAGGRKSLIMPDGTILHFDQYGNPVGN
jgi:hypothetical protein